MFCRQGVITNRDTPFITLAIDSQGDAIGVRLSCGWANLRTEQHLPGCVAVEVGGELVSDGVEAAVIISVGYFS